LKKGGGGIWGRLLAVMALGLLLLALMLLGLAGLAALFDAGTVCPGQQCSDAVRMVILAALGLPALSFLIACLLRYMRGGRTG